MAKRHVSKGPSQRVEDAARGGARRLASVARTNARFPEGITGGAFLRKGAADRSDEGGVRDRVPGPTLSCPSSIVCRSPSPFADVQRARSDTR